jgi:TetR/AcrR family transcriptional regulator, transcriptional repressor for nem operon
MYGLSMNPATILAGRIMARPKEFDEDVVLQRAMEMFWERGYQATSTADLVEHLGIGRASLYGTFGSKHELFLRALDRYVDARVESLTAVLTTPGPVLPAIETVVNLFVKRASDLERPGCMVVNTAAELGPSDALAARRVQSTWSSLESTLASALLRARAQGEISEDKNPDAIASFLTVFIQGLLVVGKGAPNPKRLRLAAGQALSILC